MNGVLKDLLTFWEHTSIKNQLEYSEDEPKIHLNSANTTFSNDMRKNNIAKKITQEFNFFDSEYFTSDRRDAYIHIYFSGHGF